MTDELQEYLKDRNMNNLELWLKSNKQIMSEIYHTIEDEEQKKIMQEYIISLTNIVK